MILNVYKYGKCQSISNIGFTLSEEQFENIKNSIIVYKVLFILPFTIFSSFIFVEQFYKSFKLLMNFCRKTKQTEHRRLSINKCFSLFNVDDEIEIIFSQSDFNYVLNLVNKYQKSKPNNTKITLSKQEIESLNDEYNYSRVVCIKQDSSRNIIKRLIKILNIYDLINDDNFKFTSRFINTISVATVTLYYFVLTLFYFYTIQTEQLINLYSFAIIEFDEIEMLKPILEKLIIIDYLRKIILIPIFVAAFFCYTQLFLLIVETKKYLIQIYKGKCEFISLSNKKMSKNNVGILSLSFGGYLVGFLIWGYLILYVFFLLIAILYYLIDNFVTFKLLIDTFYKYLIQFVVVFIIKYILRRIMIYSFVKRNTQILALDNFRAYNIVLYFMFFFDLFLGFLNAVFRLLKGVLASVLMMSSIFFC